MDLKSYIPGSMSYSSKQILFAIMLNGFGNSIFNIVGQLYLASFGLNSAEIGLIIMMNAVGTALLTIPTGVMGDRYGNNKVLMSGIVFMNLGLTVFLLSNALMAFMTAFLLLGISNAAFLVLVPVYASFFQNEDMDKAFGLKGTLSIMTHSIGSLFGFIPPMFVTKFGFTYQKSYGLILAIAWLLSLIQIPFFYFSLKGVIEKRRERIEFTLKSRGVLAKFVIIAIIGSFGYGIFLNLFPFYVKSKYGIESAGLGMLIFLSSFVSAGANFIAPRISSKLGSLETLALSTILAGVFYAGLGIAPTFIWISIIYMIRLFFGQLGDPLINSLFMKLTYDDEKATANSIRMMGLQIGGIIGPWLGGMIMQTKSLELPAYIGGIIYVIYGALFYFILRNEKEKNFPVEPIS